MRGDYRESGRGHINESVEEAKIRLTNWQRNHLKIAEWECLFEQLGDDKENFITLISDNEFLPEKVLGITSALQKKLYLHYLTIPRIISLLGMVNKESPTYSVIFRYIRVEFSQLYNDIICFITESESQQQYVFRNFIGFLVKPVYLMYLTT